MDVRKNQATLTDAEWGALRNAIDQTHGMGIPAPRYRDFVRVHVDAMTTVVGMAWGVHTMQNMGMVGRNFLSWHRQYLRQLERRLQRVDPTVTVPYWDWTHDRAIPAALSEPAQLDSWGVTRGAFDPSLLPTAAVVQAITGLTTFPPFQANLEAIHGTVHNAVGGTMMSAASPTDPLFWLHHANVDRIWAQWQAPPTSGPEPPNSSERLKPTRVAGAPMFGVSVAKVLDIGALGYSYA